MSEIVDVPLFNGVYKNIDETMVTDESHRLIDGYLDENQNLNSRPGLLQVAALNTSKAIESGIWIDLLQKYFVLSDGDLWVLDSGFSGTNLSATGVKLGNGRPTFAYDGSRILVANGGRIMYSDGVTATAFISDADAPTTCTHIVMLDSYLLANDVDSDTWYFSEIADTLVWSALDFATAGSEPDYVNALIKFRGEALLFGRETLEIWENDGQTPFVRVNGGSFDTGCIAPNSVITLENEIFWLSNKRKICKFSGSGIEIISSKYDLEIENFNVVTDCTVDRYDIRGRTFLVFQFPSEGRTIVYNQTNDNWGEWGFWNVDGGYHEAFLGSCHIYIPDSKTHIVGSRKQDGKLFRMSADYFTDNGAPIVCKAISGHIDYGTNNLKRNIELSFRVKRGYVTDATEPVASFRFKDNNGEWGQAITSA
jgi:hypothetical protein